MRMRVSGGTAGWVAVLAIGLAASVGGAQIPQPPGVTEALQGLTSEPATHSAFTFDRDTLQSAASAFDNGRGLTGPVAGLDSITFETYRYHDPAFYIPESVHALMRAYNRAGWTHLVDQNAGPKESSAPTHQITDLWLHMNGMNVDGLTVLIRGSRQMSVIEVAGILKPLDLLHLSGHFGIPKVDPNAVMVPAPPER